MEISALGESDHVDTPLSHIGELNKFMHFMILLDLISLDVHERWLHV